jgi:hypothetical protein
MNFKCILLLCSCLVISPLRHDAFGQDSDVNSPPRIEFQIDPTASYDTGTVLSGARYKTWFQTGSLQVRYRPSRSTLVLGTVPYLARQNRITSSGQTFETGTHGIGDVEALIEQDIRLGDQSPWQFVIAGRGQFPTGKSTYKNSNDALGLGHYVLGAVIGIQRVSEPVFFSFAVEGDYIVPRIVEYYTPGPAYIGAIFHRSRVAPEPGGSVQTTLGYAISDQWTVFEQLSYTHLPNIYLINSTNPVVQPIDQGNLMHNFTYRPSRAYAIHFRFVLGLRKASTDVSAGIGFQFNFGSTN